MGNLIISPSKTFKKIKLGFFTLCLVLQIWQVSSYGTSKSVAIPAAINRHHSVSIQKVNLLPSQYSPSTIEVKSAAPSFTIKFNSASSRLNLLHKYEPVKAPSPKTSFSEDEPHILRHAVSKPIIQEVHEIITPYRRIVQEVKPVVESINTIVSRKSNKSPMKSNEHKLVKIFPDNNVHQVAPENKLPTRSDGESMTRKLPTTELTHHSVRNGNEDKDTNKPDRDSPQPDLVLSENELVDNSIYNGNNELDLKYVSPNSGQAQSWLQDKYTHQLYRDR